MKKTLSFLSAVLCLALLFSACTTTPPDGQGAVSSESSSLTQTPEPVSQVKEFRLAYSSMDTLDPYSAKSKQNKELSTLLYDSLFAVDSSYRIIYRIGKAIEYYEKFCVVTLAENIYFTDGTLLTAADVVTSFNAAKDSKTAGYQDDLSNFKACTQLSDFVVTFELKEPSIDAAYALTFPVYKSGTRGKKLSNGVAKAPVGSGRYIFSNTNGNAALFANTAWAFGEIRTKTLTLHDTIDSEALSFCLSNGKVNCSFDDLYDEAIETANGSNVQFVPMNNIVFLGVNSNSKYFGNNNFKNFLNFALDRTRICDDIYLSRAVPAAGVFNPAYSQISDKMGLSATASAAKAEELFKDLGFDEKKDAQGYVTAGGERLTVRIVVSSASSFRTQTANYLSTLLNTYGISCSVSVLENDAYLSALKSGEYDIYVGEMKIGSDLGLNALLSVYGAPNETLKTYKKYRSGSITVTEFIDAFEEELPVIPLCFRLGAAYLPKNMQGDMNPSYSDVYFNIQNCYFS